MFNFNKKYLVAVLVLVAIAAAAFFLSGSSKKAIDPKAIFVPVPASTTGVIITHESTGMRSRTMPRPTADGGKIEEIGYQDNRRGEFTYDAKGKLSGYKAYAAEDNQRLVFDAHYDGGSCLISYSRTFRADGTLESEYKRSPDGAEQEFFYDAAGVCIRTATTNPDGSRKVVTGGDEGAAVETEEFPAQEQTVTYGERKTKTGSVVPEFTVKLRGVRVSSWEYRDIEGVLRHRGRILDDGDVEVTLLVTVKELFPNGEPATPSYYGVAASAPRDPDTIVPLATQIWTPTGEDWSRRYYRLKSGSVCDGKGEVVTNFLLNSNGSLSQVQHFNAYNGYMKQYAELYDENGYQIGMEYYDVVGNVQNRYETPPGSRQQMQVPAGLKIEFGSVNVGVGVPEPNGKVYRLTGYPFSEAIPENGYKVTPLFYLP